jgi:hypothetical protein
MRRCESLDILEALAAHETGEQYERYKVEMTGKKGGVTYISPGDAQRVTKGVHIRSGYATLATGKLHAFILGKRPDHIPEDWVIDHKDRDKLNNCRENLRWVSPAFNAWNIDRSDRKQSHSQYPGVSKSCSVVKTWRARAVGGHHIGFYLTEREAAEAAAKSLIRQFGEWAATSDLLVGDAAGKFTTKEMRNMILDMVEAGDEAPETKSYPSCVKPVGSLFRAKCRDVDLGIFLTVSQAADAVTAFKKRTLEKKWTEHQKRDIVRDESGLAIIKLSGSRAAGLCAIVDDELWHRLTFRGSWCYDGTYAICNRVRMHTVVYSHHNESYQIGRESQVDHIDPESKLDNRISNLRIATNSQQAQNKQKRNDCTSKHIGVYKRLGRTGWAGEVRRGSDRHRKWFKSEEEAAAWVIAKRLELNQT